MHGEAAQLAQPMAITTPALKAHHPSRAEESHLCDITSIIVMR
jgi:hypothetical protein